MSDHVVFEDFSLDVKNVIKEKAISFLYGVGEDLRSQASRNSRRDKGDTAGKYKYKVDTSSLSCHVGSNFQNAIWEEFGTGVHALHGDGRSDPWFVPVWTYHGKKRPSYKGKVTIVHGKEGKTYYKTDGKSPNRPLWKAFESSKTKIINQANQIFGELN